MSYSWDSEAHRAWVRSLAERVQASGVSVLLDQWDVKPGSDLLHYMETSIRQARFVVLVCTETFAEKANSGGGGVGYEKSIVTGELFARVSPETKFVPILRSGNQQTALPSYLLSKVFIDFRREATFETALESLLRHLHDAPEFTRPPLGKKPPFHSQAAVESTPLTSREPQFVLPAFDRLFRYAYGSGGLNLGKEQAVAWAEDKVRQSPSFDLDQFQKLFRYAYGSGGLNLGREQAVAWAEDKVRQGPTFDVGQFEKLFRYAYGSGGLNLTREQAIRWAEEHATSG